MDLKEITKMLYYLTPLDYGVLGAVLLFMSLSREFGFEYPPYDTAEISTTGALARIIMEKTGYAGRQDPGDQRGTERI